MKAIRIIFIVTFLLGVVGNHPAWSQPDTERAHNQFDPLFPEKNKLHMGFITTYSVITPPPVFITDITYGISKNTSIGVLVGTTGAIALYGVKFNKILVRNNQFKLQFRMTSIYYPKRNGRFLFDRQSKHVMPWMLSMGVVDAEWKLAKNILWSIGVGAMETHCVDDMKSWFHQSNEFHETEYPEFYHTIQTSLSFPISKRMTLRPEIIGVMKNWRLIEREKFKVPLSINPYLNVIIDLSN